jgi:hypothetical protein
VTDLLPGQLTYVFAVSILDAAFLSWLALLWYRRSVRRLMREGAPGSAALPAAPPVATSQSLVEDARTHSAVGVEAPSLELDELSREDWHPDSTNAGSGRRAWQRRVVLAYVAGAAAYAAVVTTLKFSAASPTLPAVAWLADWWMNSWPMVPAIVALLVLDRTAAVRLALRYVVAGAVAIALFTAVGQLVRGSFNSAPLTNVFWAMAGLAWAAWVPLVLIALTGWRRVRAVTPLVLAATLLFGFGSILSRELLIRALDVGPLRTLVLNSAALSSAGAVQYGLFMLVALPVGWIAWRVLTALSGAFAKKRFSDVQMIVDCWWFIVTAEVTATTLSITHGVAGIFGGAAAFAAYRVSVFALLRGFNVPDVTPRRLLLLRVFGYQGRTESLFDRVAQEWRFHGPVQLIAGVDLAMRTADPGDVLAFLNGRLAELYVRTPGEVRDRIAHLDFQTDPDGRFRINEVYCHEHTWRSALEALLGSTDIVLMDLRSFSASNAGCVFELEQLVARLDSDNIVLVCDRTTDLPLLREILDRAWTAARPAGRATISIVRVERNSRPELGVLMKRLLRPQAAAC